MIHNSRQCKECGIKLPSRNKNRKTFSNLCQRCFTHPPLDKRCISFTSRGTRCMFRITGESTHLCKLHARRKKND